MPSNYRLPLKHFEKKSLKDRELYNSNLLKVRLWPILTVVVCLALLSGLGYTYFKNKNTKYEEVILSKTSIQDELLIGNCKLKLEDRDNNFNWNSKDCSDTYSFELSTENKENYSKISHNPDYYLKFNKTNTSIINSNLLIEPIVAKTSNYLKKDQLKKFSNVQSIDLYGPCTFKSSCELVKVINENNINYIKKGILKDFLTIPDLKEIKLTEENKELYIEVIANNVQRYKVDLGTNSLQTL
jgi:hypothetical protein